MRVLIIEDEDRVANFLVKGLKEVGHIVDIATNGVDGLHLASTEKYDAMIIDRMLPDIEGLAIIHTLRSTDNDTPVLILSALGEIDDRVKGLQAGGDDYLVKPFSFSELVARLDALTRRTRGKSHVDTKITVSDLVLNILNREVHRAGRKINLQPREFELLKYLMVHTNQVVTRTMLLEHVWEYNFDPQTNVIDVHISRLRRKIDQKPDKPLIHTIRGAGYRLYEKS